MSPLPATQQPGHSHRLSAQVHLFKMHVIPFLTQLLPEFRAAFEKREQLAKGGLSAGKSLAEKKINLLRASDVFFWAVASGRWELALSLWRLTKNPVRTCILASRMCTVMSLLLETHRERLESMSAAFEQRATGILDEFAAGSSTRAFLTEPAIEWNKSL